MSAPAFHALVALNNPKTQKTEQPLLAQHPISIENSSTASLLSEVELIGELSRQDSGLSIASAIARLQPYTSASDTLIRSAALRLSDELYARSDAFARQAARDAAERAEDLVSEENFAAAMQVLASTRAALPAESPWSQKHGAATLRAMEERIAAQRATSLHTAETTIAAALANPDDSELQKTLNGYLKHSDPLLRETAARLKTAAEEAAALETQKHQAAETQGRPLWLNFFNRLDDAILEGDFPRASKLCAELPAASGVENPQAVLQSCAAEVHSIQALYDAALSSAAERATQPAKSPIVLTMRRSNVAGEIQTVAGRQITVRVQSGAQVGVKVDALTSSGLAALLDPAVLDSKKLRPAMAALIAIEKAPDFEQSIVKTYGAMGSPLPAHWAQRIKLERNRRVNKALETQLGAVGKALDSGDRDALAAAFDLAQPLLKSRAEFGPLPEEQSRVVADAKKILGNSRRERIVLQNGVQPDAAYNACVADQIAERRGTNLQTSERGLAAGAAGGVERILLRFEKIEELLANCRVRHAELEMTALDLPHSAGASIGLFRVKTEWAHGRVSWVQTDSDRKMEWAIPGASGALDIADRDESSITIDKKAGTRCVWDLTQYFRDLAAGKVQNRGFMLRIVNGEPEYEARFYSDTCAIAERRPKLTLDIERGE